MGGQGEGHGTDVQGREGFRPAPEELGHDGLDQNFEHVQRCGGFQPAHPCRHPEVGNEVGTDMEGMFQGAIKFDQAITTWDTTGAKNMKYMFNGAVEFNQELTPGTKMWVLTSVETMEGMFQGATKFNNGNKDTIKNWDTTALTNSKNMFNGAEAFNQPIPYASVRARLKTAAPLNMFFQGAKIFDQD